jgi:ATP-binding protein involved in chromosome partitioning
MSSQESLAAQLTQDPELLSLGIAPEVEVRGAGRAVLTLVLPSPRRLSPELVERLRARALSSGFTELEVVSRLEVLSRTIAEDDPAPEVKNLVLVMSGKGGVGKSTVCANTAVAFSELGAKVGLLDADIYGPSVPTLFGVQERPQGDGQKFLPIERHGLKLMSIGFLLETERTAVIWRGPMLQSALLQFVGDVAWGPLDYLFLDLPPGTGDVAITIAQKLSVTGALIVTTPEEMALADVYKAVGMNEKVGIFPLGVVENQSYFMCPNCSSRHHLFGAGGGEKVAAHARAPLLAALALDPAVQRCSDQGTPIVRKEPQSSAASAFLELAERLGERITERNRSAGSPLVIDRSGGKNRHLPVAR